LIKNETIEKIISVIENEERKERINNNAKILIHVIYLKIYLKIKHLK
jgi:hypothetical protein